MKTDNPTKLKITTRNVAFLMQHQHILSELKEIIKGLLPTEDKINKESPEYLLGAHDALISLISDLEEKSK